MSDSNIVEKTKMASNPCIPECPHARVAEDSLKIVQSSPTGLSQEEANARLKSFGPNALPQTKLNAVARQLNERPRETLNYETPAERFNACVASTG